MAAAYPRQLLAALGPVITAARRVLADREADDIPASLRKVATSSARRLPPPLARTLLDHLDGDDAFRAEVAEASSDDLDDLGVAFLTRPPGWWRGLVVAVGEGLAAAEREAAAEARSAADRLRDFAAEGEGRMRAAQARAAEVEAEAKREIEALRARVRATPPARTADGDGERRAAELERELERIRAAHADLERRARAQGERIRRLRRSRPAAGSAPTGSLPAEPIARAKALDHQFEVLARAGRAGARAEESAAPPAAGAPSGGFGLPPGVAPDYPDALRWLLAAPAATVVVDGYNVLYRSTEQGSKGGPERRRLEAALRRLHRQSQHQHAVIVVYDSALGGERPQRTRSGGVEVRFAAGDRIADDEIIELAGALTSPVVVVSSDREVREEAARAGAITLWSEVLVPLLRG
jgi:predicted RNA-binding protein with PIN domain